MLSNLQIIRWPVFVFALSIIGLQFVQPTLAESKFTHIVSYVHQKHRSKFDEFTDFDIENESARKVNRASSNLFSGSLIKQMDENGVVNSSIDTSTMSRFETAKNAMKPSDDYPTQYLNTLQNATSSTNNHNRHILALSNNDMDLSGSRVKQSIRVLEPVKHLLNTVRNGTLNETSSKPNGAHHKPHSKHPHQLLGSVGGIDQDESGVAQHHDSAAIETEEEREMVNESTSFHFLELLGTLGSMIWTFFTNLSNIFAASSAGTSGA